MQSVEFLKEEAELGLGAPDQVLDTLPDTLWEEILVRIPDLSSLASTSCVCKQWRRLTASPTFLALHSDKLEELHSWLYVNGFRYRITDQQPLPEDECNNNSSPSSSSAQLFEDESIKTSASSLTFFNAEAESCGPGGVFYVLDSEQSKLLYRVGVSSKSYVETPVLTHPRTIPIIGVVKNTSKTDSCHSGHHKLLCIGGLPCDGTTAPLLKLEIFSSDLNSWEEGEDLPAEFQGLATFRSVTAAVRGRKMYVFHIYSGTVASYDVDQKSWSAVTTMRPDGAQYCYLGVHGGKLLLVGVSYEDEAFVFRGWTVDESTMGYSGPPRQVMCHFSAMKSSGKSSEQLEKYQSTWSACSSALADAALLRPSHHMGDALSLPGVMQSWALRYFLNISKCMPRSPMSIGVKLFDYVFRF